MLVPARLWGQTRASVTGAVVWSALLVFLLTLAIGRSTAAAGWVAGIDVVVIVALAGAALLGLLAIAPLPWAAGLGVGAVAGVVAAAIAAGPALHAAHPEDTLSIALVGTWWTRISNGSAADDTAFYFYLISLLMWVTGGWLSWCVLRWHRPMLGLVPGAAAFATNLLNSATEQNGYVLAILVLTLALLLWTNYTSSIANATRARVKLTGDARWDFWESGLVAMAALIVLAILLPPLSTGDKTLEMQSSIFSSWAQLQERLNHPTVLGRGPAAGGSTGFSTDVALSGPLKRSHAIVFAYTFTSTSGTRYFRGVNVTQTSNGLWRYPTTVHFRAQVPKNQSPQYGEDYSGLALTGYKIRMISPPVGSTDILFYPGMLLQTDRESIATQVDLLPDDSLRTIDRLSSAIPPVSAGAYSVTTEYSTATEDQLRAAGTAYPDWLASYAGLPAIGYRSQEDLIRIKALAVDITKNAITPYDKAKAIETYLRSSLFTYTLTPPQTPDGQDRLAYFLFTSRIGFCQYFASAMGDMLRSIGIPTRLVNGFGPGLYDTTTQAWIVRDEDAHTWVESYFPTYGWIPFEPTPDVQNGYVSITRGVPQGPGVCLRDSQCGGTTGGTTGGPTPSVVPPGFREPNGGPNAGDGGGVGGPFGFRMPDAGTLMKVVGVVLAILLILFAGVARYLRPRSVTLVWKRVLTLAQLAGAERRTGETPLELGRRLASEFPEASEPVRSLADGFVVSAYAPPDMAGTARASVMDAWVALRPMLLRRVAARLRVRRA